MLFEEALMAQVINKTPSTHGKKSAALLLD